jgi:polyvinyl alcohol dehydrogenase (cytochrome)
VVSSAAVATVSINNMPTPIVYVGGGDDNLYALNTDGTTRWQTLLDPSGPNTFIWDSPVVFKNTVYIGTATTGESDHCPLVVGKFFALNAATGAIEHTFIGIPSNCVGGGIWSSPTIDPSDGSIYFTVGTKQAKCKSDTFSLGIVKMRASDLKLLSSWQIPLSERTTSDSDFAGTPTLFTATLSDGLVHNLVGAVDKNGYFYAFDRSNLAATNPVWSTQISTEPGPCPQCGKGSISSAVWDGGKNLYVAGGHTLINGLMCGGSLQDLDPATGTPQWQDCLSGTVLGALTLVPGVIALVDGSTLSLFNAKGAELPLFTSNIDLFYGSPSISNGVLYAGSKSGHLYAFSPTP